MHEVDERFHVVGPFQSVTDRVEHAVEAVVDGHIVPALIEIEERKLRLVDRKNSVAVTAVVSCQEPDPEIILESQSSSIEVDTISEMDSKTN